MLYFYFSFADKSKQNYLDLILSLIAQLLRQEIGRKEVEVTFRNDQKHVNALELTLCKILENCEYDTVRIVIDGLDECPEDDSVRDEILNGLRVLEGYRKVRLLLTSRKELDIDEFMRDMDALSVRVENAEVDRDIELYVWREISRHRRLRTLDAAVKKQIERDITRKSGGMQALHNAGINERKER